MELSLFFLGEPSPELVARGVRRKAAGELGALFERTNRGPESPLDLFRLLGGHTLERERMAHVTAKRAEPTDDRFGELPLADRADDVGGGTELIPLEFGDLRGYLGRSGTAGVTTSLLTSTASSVKVATWSIAT